MLFFFSTIHLLLPSPLIDDNRQYGLISEYRGLASLTRFLLPRAFVKMEMF